MKKLFKLTLIATGIALMTSVSAFAQDPGPDPGGDPDAPIDGGLSILAAAGVVYGVSVLRKKKNTEETI